MWELLKIKKWGLKVDSTNFIQYKEIIEFSFGTKEKEFLEVSTSKLDFVSGFFSRGFGLDHI